MKYLSHGSTCPSVCLRLKQRRNYVAGLGAGSHTGREKNVVVTYVLTTYPLEYYVVY